MRTLTRRSAGARTPSVLASGGPRARAGAGRRRPARLLPTWDATLLVHARRTGRLPERFRPLIFRGSRRHPADRRRTVPGMPAATPALAHSPLEPLLQKAGATMVARHGWWVAAHFGSPAGELALCETAVGQADRSDLGKLELRGEPSALEQLVGQLSGGSVAPGDALLAAGAWWCAVSPSHVLALCDGGGIDSLRDGALDAVRWTAGATVTDVTLRYAAIGLLGPRTGDVLGELADTEPPLGDTEEPAFDVLRLAAIPAMLLRGAPGRALMVTEAGRAAALWTEVERAGREAGIGHAGADAVSHLSPLPRR